MFYHTIELKLKISEINKSKIKEAKRVAVGSGVESAIVGQSDAG